TNACYVEQIKNLPKYLPQYMPRTTDMCVNTEWPGFFSHSLPILNEDQELDAESDHPGQHSFEKLTAGLYLGDVARRILLRFAQAGHLFGSRVPECLLKYGAVDTSQIGRIHSDDTTNLLKTGAFLEEVVGVSPEENTETLRIQVKEIFSLVANRSAQLMAATVAGLLTHLDRVGSNGPSPHNVLAIDGGILLNWPNYRVAMKAAIKDICGPSVSDNLEMKIPVGGAAFGAACIAAAASNYMRSAGHGYTPPARSVPSYFPPRRPSQTS
ncbi:hypothetical protein WJX84_010542, partial [Apatococcus fuscideae]